MSVPKKNMYTTDHWVDALGQKYGPGDCIAYASISGRSPQLVVGEVLSIHTHDTEGRRYTQYGYNPMTDERGQHDSVSVKVQPLLDARDFYRSDKARAVHLKIPANILKLPNELKPLPKEQRELEKSTSGIMDILKSLSE